MFATLFKLEDNHFMTRFLSSLCLILSSAILLYLMTPIKFYTQSKQDRLIEIWKKDIEFLMEKKNAPLLFKQISKLEVVFTDPDIAEEFKNFTTPFSKNSAGKYSLKIAITRWIDRHEYGFVIQHEFFDHSDDKHYEFGRTYKIGYVF